jgi:ABC-type nitrate/sulfonate/bicarbonate transport system substrate-binding protein
LAVALLVSAQPTPAEESFAKKVGDVKASDLKPAEAYDLPFLLWGGDVATFLANGGDKATRKDTLFEKHGLKFNLVRGDDFLAQVKNYMEGKTPYLRGTMGQIGLASEVLGQDERTKPVVFLQMTWSAGDHMVSRPTSKTLNDLKGKRIALQWGGPHVSMLDDVLKSVGLKWSDIKVEWTTDVSGDKGPAEKFRKDTGVDACFVVTPEMLELTSGGGVGTGAEKSVKGAKVLVSTLTLNHSIADVYACRKDFYDKNKETIAKLTAAYLKACEDLVALRVNFDKKEKDKELEKKYKALLAMTKAIYGKDDIPDEEAAHGLVKDAVFVGLTGNYNFFNDENNPINFKNRAKAAVTLAVEQGYAAKRFDLTAATVDTEALKKLGDLSLAAKPPVKVVEIPVGGNVDPEKDTVYSFTVLFPPDSVKVDLTKYEGDFRRAIEAAALYGNSMIQVRGHVDPTLALQQFVTAGMKNGVLSRTGSKGAYKYYLKKTGTSLELSDTKAVLDLIAKNPGFSDEDPEKNAKVTVELAAKLSEDRSAAVRKTILELAEKQGVRLSQNQFKSEGVGIKEPVIAVPRSDEQTALNRRVEFRILKLSPERVTNKEFDY